MKKGFTLIELLAVIIILGVIAVIAIPVISNVIEDSKKRAAEVSALNYIEAVNEHLSVYVLKTGGISDGTYTPDQIRTLLGEDKISSNEPSNKTTITIAGNKVTDYSIISENYIVTKENGKAKVATYAPPACQRQTGTEGTFNYGDLFVCDLGDEVDRNFYVFKIDDDTVDFISQKHIDGNYRYSQALTYFEDRNYDEKWPKAEKITLPSAKQFAVIVNQDSEWDPTISAGFKLNTNVASFRDSNGYSIFHWLYDYTNNCSTGCMYKGTEYGANYWLLEEKNSSDAWAVAQYGEVRTCSKSGCSGPIRPVVTVLKKEING